MQVTLQMNFWKSLNLICCSSGDTFPLPPYIVVNTVMFFYQGNRFMYVLNVKGLH